MSGSGRITAQVCMSASRRFLQTLGSIPHRTIEGVPTSWMFSSSESGHINAEIFYQWLGKVFIPNCGKERPFLLVLDNHDNHIFIPTIKAAIENGVVLVGFPGHTTHILQPLDVKIVTNVGYVRDGVTVGNHKFPAILRHAIDQTSKASAQKPFEVTGQFPVNRNAIDTLQLITPTFSTAETSDGKIQFEAETCLTCGYFIKNPLVTRGIVPERLAQILVPPPAKPVAHVPKMSKKRVEKGRVVSTEEMLLELQEKERQEEEKRAGVEPRKKDAEEKHRVKAQEAEEKRQRKETTKAAREEKRKNEEDEKEARKRARMEKKSRPGRKEFREREIARVRAFSFVCGVCREHGTVTDEEKGLFWYSCDGCDRWFHNVCLSVDDLCKAVESLNGGEWMCDSCRPGLIEE
ncbi:hypothetical protein MAR_031421 [Mya arenaria]|uniref:PHD-type domain-containing protein n=1 Tax=Mya arenaria TaxID=6604 RepID=A0ABY7F740_MYAAR|nr:hypothetical protein MAR_031421 [Mya arenaria]